MAASACASSLIRFHVRPASAVQWRSIQAWRESGALPLSHEVLQGGADFSVSSSDTLRPSSSATACEPRAGRPGGDPRIASDAVPTATAKRGPGECLKVLGAARSIIAAVIAVFGEPFCLLVT